MYIKMLKKARGFTLIELLVVVLILAILMAIALPLYLSAVADSELKTCRANMQTIGNAFHARHVATRGVSNVYPVAASTAVTTTNCPDLLAVPVCPKSGSYTVEAPTSGGAFDVKCSVAAHDVPGNFIYGVSAQ